MQETGGLDAMPLGSRWCHAGIAASELGTNGGVEWEFGVPACGKRKGNAREIRKDDDEK